MKQIRQERRCDRREMRKEKPDGRKMKKGRIYKGR
jgi:hypothetical protein